MKKSSTPKRNKMSKRSIPLSSKKSRQDCAADGRGVGYTGVVSSSERLGVLWGDVSDVDEPASEIVSRLLPSPCRPATCKVARETCLPMKPIIVLMAVNNIIFGEGFKMEW
ncbi:uncharacterized protein LACBIDRAFT_301369 [Laccaria bicolor S238N-H82]|uniref:Predicted protein n=1 Tax=Laccaria bicolor (strain S238N-H82 / ATCC MYA-4686) TaxID=486041 RepID=B0CNE1_LACBS|nr:uncharacterized protein LACBIDRAFT_301369 [Laccaria bicolor S238N-H82]EDR15913.1 predicted protein [Laccaria bicolor S238N-H82]|eukprot:XP_001874121.1 predicted protein [Laccaria bicolor S238N-H82]